MHFIKFNLYVIANQHKWSPLLWRRKLIRISKTFHGPLESSASTVSTSRVSIKTSHKRHWGFLRNCPVCYQHKKSTSKEESTCHANHTLKRYLSLGIMAATATSLALTLVYQTFSTCCQLSSSIAILVLNCQPGFEANAISPVFLFSVCCDVDQSD